MSNHIETTAGEWALRAWGTAIAFAIVNLINKYFIYHGDFDKLLATAIPSFFLAGLAWLAGYVAGYIKSYFSESAATISSATQQNASSGQLKCQSSLDDIEAINKLHELYKKGALSEAEFGRLKTNILSKMAEGN